MLGVNSIKSVVKNWGHEKIYCNVKDGVVSYCCKILSFRSPVSENLLDRLRDNATSWHYHKTKDEVLTLVSGEGVLFFSDLDCISDDTLLVSSVMRVHLIKDIPVRIKPGLRHMILSLSDLILLEGSSFHDDRDTVRLSFTGIS